MKLHEMMIAEQFDSLLDGLGHETVGLQLAVERKLEAVGAPAVSWHMETGETGLFKALAGKRRDFLCIEHSRLREYTVLISARPFGTALHVSWLLLVMPRLANDLRRAIRLGTEREARFDIGAELDVFDNLDFNAFLSLTRLALKTAIRELTDSDEDPEDPGDIRGSLANEE